MARRRKDRDDPFRAQDNMSHYGGVRSTPRTRAASRPVTTRVPDPLDAIGGRFFKPDLAAFEVTPIGASSSTRPAGRVTARAAKPGAVLPSKRRQMEALFKAPDPLAKGRKASEYALRPTKTAIRQLLTPPRINPKAPPRRSGGLSKGIVAGLKSVPSGLLSQVKQTLTSVRPRRTPTELPATSPRKSVTVVRGPDHVRADPLHAKRSPSVRDGMSASTCKARPEDNRPKRGGKGSRTSREFIPWCEATTRRR